MLNQICFLYSSGNNITNEVFVFKPLVWTVFFWFIVNIVKESLVSLLTTSHLTLFLQHLQLQEQFWK